MEHVGLRSAVCKEVKLQLEAQNESSEALGPRYTVTCWEGNCDYFSPSCLRASFLVTRKGCAVGRLRTTAAGEGRWGWCREWWTSLFSTKGRLELVSAREERGVTPGWAARVPANLLHVVQRHEHLWQLPPRLLWSDVNRGESVPSPGQAGQSSAQGPETRLPPCEETLARPEHQGQMRTEQPRHHPGLFPSSPRRAEAAVKVVQVHAGK